jgi:hypothetical protein
LIKTNKKGTETMLYTKFSALLRSPANAIMAARVSACRNAQKAHRAAVSTRHTGSGTVKQDELGRALAQATDAYLRAIKPTHQLTHNLIVCAAQLLARDNGEQVSIRIGSIPAITRKPIASAAA